MILHDLQSTRSWQDDFKEGYAKGFAQGYVLGFKEGQARVYRRLARRCLAKGMSFKQVAELMDISLKEVRRLAKDTAK